MAMASLHFIFISAVILTFGTQMGSAIKCVECNSHYEKWCEDIPADFNYTKHPSNKYNEYLRDCDTKDDGTVDGLSYTMCRTMSQKVGSDSSRTIRMCAAHGKADKCYERTGTKNIKLSYCTCEGDWCNNAPTLLSPRLILLSLVSIILSLISFS